MDKGKIDYKKYLKSKHWKEKRLEVFERQGDRCKVCFSDDSIQIHHKRYRENGESILYKERNSLLLPLCNHCHKLWHELQGYKRIPYVRLRSLLHYGVSKTKAFKHPYARHGIKPFRLISMKRLAKEKGIKYQPPNLNHIKNDTWNNQATT